MNLDRREMLTAGLSATLLTSCAYKVRRTGVARSDVQVQAPFPMPAIRVPDFAAAPRFPITDFGAAVGDMAQTNAAIAAAVDAAHAADGGVVVVPEGSWVVGPIHLKSNVNLHVSRGATLLFSADPSDYLPPVHSSWEGIECFNYSPLVYAYECENVALTGEGTLHARLDTWEQWFKRPKAHMDALVELYQMARRNVPAAERDMTRGSANLRPQFVQFNRCRNVLIEDVRIRNSPFWTIHPYLCSDVVIRRVDIFAHGHNNDGVDPEMSRNVLIEECVFDQGDDAVAIKSGREDDAWRLATPSRNIVIRDCRVKNGHQLVAIGSEMSGGVENVFIDGCHFAAGEVAAKTPIANILFIKTNERRGGFVRNIHMSNVTATQVEGGILAIDTDVLYQWRTLVPTYQRRLTPIADIHVSNVRVEEAAFVASIKGEAELPVRRVVLRGNSIAKSPTRPIIAENVEGLVAT